MEVVEVRESRKSSRFPFLADANWSHSTRSFVLGTSWRGTITKLGFPGLLFHHQTRSKDWYFDDLKPWVHYVPVAWHLADLREKFDWAEKNQEKAKQIADNASKFYDYMMSEKYMQRVYRELFVDYLGKVLEAFVPSTRSWDDAKRKYEQDGFTLRQVSVCDNTSCHTPGSDAMTTVSIYGPNMTSGLTLIKD